MVEEREEKSKALQAMLDKSLAEGGEATEQDIDAAIEAKGYGVGDGRLLNMPRLRSKN